MKASLFSNLHTETGVPVSAEQRAFPLVNYYSVHRASVCVCLWGAGILLVFPCRVSLHVAFIKIQLSSWSTLHRIHSSDQEEAERGRALVCVSICLCVCVWEREMPERDDPRILPFISTSTLAKKGGCPSKGGRCLIVRVHQEKAHLQTSVGLSSRPDVKKL